MNKYPVTERFFYSLNPEQREDLRVILDAELKDDLIEILVNMDNKLFDYDEVFDKGYDHGFDEGKEEAEYNFDDRYDEGYEDGYKDGKANLEKEKW